jgi:hypothetical protein
MVLDHHHDAEMAPTGYGPLAAHRAPQLRLDGAPVGGRMIEPGHARTL